MSVSNGRGQLRLANCVSPTASGQLRLSQLRLGANCVWPTASGQLRLANCVWPTASEPTASWGQLRLANCVWPTASGQLRLANCVLVTQLARRSWPDAVGPFRVAMTEDIVELVVCTQNGFERMTKEALREHIQAL
ncbi:hypothetical protein niasHT_004548 [Heterodera trifolii]|uniref:Uncharacterized protein n=1 Tax=Heterodera trifolii TaxID=157864 RepID=A0ABD2M0A1_9BILA